jgi:hypothetical protein
LEIGYFFRLGFLGEAVAMENVALKRLILAGALLVAWMWSSTCGKADSLWDHNGSMMRLKISGNSRVFVYEAPKKLLFGAGVSKGTVLFNGTRKGANYQGTARRFSKNCKVPFKFQVSGYVEAERRIVLTGQREVMDASSCRGTGQFATETLVFTFLSAAKEPPAADAASQLQPVAAVPANQPVVKKQASAQPPSEGTQSVPSASASNNQRRVALVIGNNHYVNTKPLTNAVADAQQMAQVLRRLGFFVVLGTDLDKASFDGKLREFASSLDQADMSLLFYSGHGLQVDGENYLVPVDAKAEDKLSLKFEMIRVRDLLDSMVEESGTTLVFLDSCRNNPLSRSLGARLGATRSTSVGRGMAPVEIKGQGALIAYATAPDNVAFDGEDGHSPFTKALLTYIETPGLEVNQLMTRVKSAVVKDTRGQQRPWHNSDLIEDVYLVHQAAAQ